MPVVKRGGKPDNRLRKAWAADLPDHCVAAEWSADGRLAAAAVSGPVVVFDGKTGTPTAKLAGHGFGTTAIAWQPGGSLLATAGQDGKARLWDSTGAEVAALAGGSAWVERLAWSADGKILATAAGKKVRLWDAAGTQLREYANHGGTVSDLAWKPGSPARLAVAAYGGVAFYDPAADAPVHRFEWKGSPLRLAWSPDGKYLAHGNQDATVHFWVADTSTPLQMSGYPTKVRELSWDYTGRYLATGGGPTVCVWDCGGKGPENTQPQMLEKHEEAVTAVAWQRRGFLVASAGADSRVCLWQPANKKAAHVGEDRFPGTSATTLAWSPNDSMLAVGTAAGNVTVYKVS